MLLRRIFQLLLIVLLPGLVAAQVTTGSITGTVKSSSGIVIDGAAVKAIHVPTGTTYSSVSNNDGHFTLPNLKVGGPYSVTITYVGYKNQQIEDLNVGLGNPLNIDVTLQDVNQNLEGVTVKSTGKNAIISSLRNGTVTVLSSRTLQSVPTINRSMQDFARLMPQAKVGSAAGTGNGVGVSFGGQNNRYNQFSIDGASASDGFGLSGSGTNGGQANINPISMEAIQEMQMIMSPYDVTQGGFTGGGINAVTKSGTNDFHGAVYGQIQPKGLIGKSVPYNNTVTRNPIYGDFKNYTFGAGLGGAIIKNKLFFYVNAERFEKAVPLAFDPTIAGSGSKVTVDSLEKIRQYMQNTYKYDPGNYGNIINHNRSTSFFGRIDWNINEKNKLMIRFNHVDGYLDVLSRSATSSAFSNSGYRQNNNTNSAVVELNSSISTSLSNVLRLTYSSIKDYRTTSMFPNISITNYDAATSATINYSLGSEFSSPVNSLNQKVFTVTDNVTLYKGAHTLTFGTNNEFFKSSNYFLQGYYGSYTYGSSGTTVTNNLNNFMNNTGMTSYGTINYSTSTDPNDKAPASLKAAQLSVYGGDVWTVKSNFKLTYGLRIDMPVFFNKPAENTAFNTAFGLSTNSMPKSTPLFSPRAGFNWDIKGDAQTQLRGGAGLFTGRIPFVWISNQFSNNGITSSAYSASNASAVTAAGIKFNYDPSDAHLGAYIPSKANALPVINVVDKNFKFPQVFRANLALDQKLPWWGLVGTIEAIYTKTLNNAQYTNLNLSANGDTTLTIGSTTRPLWNKTLNSSYAQVLKLSNTSQGYGYSFTAQIQKPYSDGWSGSIAYTLGHSTSVNDLTSSVALSNWRSPLTVNGLNATNLSKSNFDMGSRIVGFITKEFKYAKNFSTAFTLIYTGQTGQRISYVYGNNILGDYGSSSGATILAYIPKTAQEANFVDIRNSSTGATVKTADQQWTDFQSFVSDNKYLKDHVGRNTERNGDKTPWENHFDFRIAQNFIFGQTKVQFFWDILNVGNLLNKNWGWSYSSISSTADGFYTATNTLFSTVTSAGSGNSRVQKNGVNFTPNASSPAFTFNVNNDTNIKGTYRPYQVSDFTSRWSSQLGVRVSF